jgi:hypothetical protein
LEDPGIDRKLILKWVFKNWEVGWGGMDWFDMAQDRDRWRAVVNAGNEHSGSIKCREFLD